MPRGLLAAAALLAIVVMGCGSGRDGCDPCANSAPPSPLASLQPAGPSPTPVPAGTGPIASPQPSDGAGGLPSSASWARLEVDGAGPAAREDHTWTLDPGAGTAYLFGGRADGTTFADLWAFDLATETWAELRPSGASPAARFGHEAAWVPGIGLVVTLGQAGSGFFDDIWLFDPTTTAWRELPGGGARPVARYGSCSGIGPDGRLWISHGFTEEGSRFFDTRAYDFEAATWADVTPPDFQPVERCLHACWWTTSGDFTLYGGQTTGVAALGDLWRLEGPQPGQIGTWAKQDKPALAARQLTAVARRDGVTVVFGGRDVARKPLGDTWLLPDAAASAIARLEPGGAPPAARSGAAMVYDEARDRMLLFGGIGDAALGDLWALTFD